MCSARRSSWGRTRDRSDERVRRCVARRDGAGPTVQGDRAPDRKSTRLNSSHSQISYAVFCLKKKKYTEHLLPHCFLIWVQASRATGLSRSPFVCPFQQLANPSPPPVLASRTDPQQ